jgi:hypothetical protein
LLVQDWCCGLLASGGEQSAAAVWMMLALLLTCMHGYAMLGITRYVFLNAIH